jgi:hypothetical protein
LLARRKPIAALALSTTLHAALLYAVSRIEWPVADASSRPEQPTVQVRILRAPLREQTAPRERSVDGDLLALAPRTPRQRLAEIVLGPTTIPIPVPDAPAPTPAVEPSEQQPAAEDVEPAAPSSPTQDTGELVEQRSIDPEALRREAVANALEQIQKEQRFTKFSTEDELYTEPGAESRPEISIFDLPKRRGRSMLQPGRQRTAFGRWASELCHGLTGGIGFFGFALCADPDPRPDYFGFLRPSYLDKLPECAPVELVEPLPGGPGEPDVTSTIKCRLVDKDERYQ